MQTLLIILGWHISFIKFSLDNKSLRQISGFPMEAGTYHGSQAEAESKTWNGCNIYIISYTLQIEYELVGYRYWRKISSRYGLAAPFGGSGFWQHWLGQ